VPSIDVDVAGNIILGIGFRDTLRFFDNEMVPDDGRGVALMALDAGGELIWWNEVDADALGKQGIAVDGNGNILMAGAAAGDVFIAKYTPTGNQTWWATGGGPSTADDIFSVRSDAAGNVYVVGDLAGSGTCQFGSLSFSLPAGCFMASFLAKYTAMGEPEWVRYVHSQTFAQFSLFNTMGCHEDGVYVAGEYSDSFLRFSHGGGTWGAQPMGSSRSFMARYGADGNLSWVKVPPYSNTGADGAMAIAIGNGVHTIISFNSMIQREAGPITSYGSYDVLLERSDLDGELRAFTHIGGVSVEAGNHVLVHAGHVYLLGSSASPVFEGSGTCMVSAGPNMFLMRFSDAEVGIRDQKEVRNLSVFPNPSNGSFTVQAPREAEHISVTDALGRVVYQTKVQWARDGVTVNMEGIPSGVYFLRISGSGPKGTATVLVQ
jgi:hypothetical protein